ncbi:MAG: hypothetical protein FJ011_02670 [Chloroflexi bacterium]|nr:hypothetical protein [Chloroflexota bacterium]
MSFVLRELRAPSRLRDPNTPRQRLLAATNAAYAALRADSAAWQEVREERAAWDVTLADGLEGV